MFDWLPVRVAGTLAIGATSFAAGTVFTAILMLMTRGEPKPLTLVYYQCVHVRSGLSKASVSFVMDDAIHTLCMGCEIGYAHIFYDLAVKYGHHMPPREPVANVPEAFRKAFSQET